MKFACTQYFEHFTKTLHVSEKHTFLIIYHIIRIIKRKRVDLDQKFTFFQKFSLKIQLLFSVSSYFIVVAHPLHTGLPVMVRHGIRILTSSLTRYAMIDHRHSPPTPRQPIVAHPSPRELPSIAHPPRSKLQLLSTHHAASYHRRESYHHRSPATPQVTIVAHPRNRKLPPSPIDHTVSYDRHSPTTP